MAGHALTMRLSARLASVCALVLSATLVLSCSGGAGEGTGETGADSTLTLVAFAASEPGWSSIVPAFAATREGSDVTVTASYGASSDQSGAVAEGERADVVNVSAEPDIARLIEAGKVGETWAAGVTRGVPFGSVVSFAVRPGNPKNIRDWDDLLRPDVEVITPNPLNSGSARWNLLAPYAWASNGARDRQAGLAFVRELVAEHVRLQPASADEATDVFLRGSGDVLLTHESEALNVGLDYVNPPQTVEVEYPVAVVSTSRHLEQAIDFVNFQFLPEAQKLWAQANFRPVDPAVRKECAEKFPVPDKLWTVEELGGWELLDRQLFDKDNGAITAVYRQATR